MNEVEKMYENAGIEPDINYVCDKEPCKQYSVDCQECSHLYDTRVDYPDFTAEKQITILMFILNKFGDIGFQKMYSIKGNDENTRKDFIKCLCDCEHETLDSRPVDFYYQKGASGDNFEESLAGLINSIWQSLTEEERKQIKNILE